MPKILRYGEFISRLQDFGVIELPGRGKGSERYLIRPTIPERQKGRHTRFAATAAATL